MAYRCSGAMASGTMQRCSARPLVFRSAFQGARVQRVALSQRRQRGLTGVYAANPVGDIAKYLSDAARQIFSVQEGSDSVPWGGSGSGFEGSISHHADAAKLRAVLRTVKGARESITGCTDPNAANFDPAAMVDDGTCNYIADSTEETGVSEDLRTYMTKSLQSIFSHNFKGDETEPKDWGSTGYSYRGEKVSQRDIMRLLQYEKVVEKALDEAEAKEKK